MFSLFFIKSTSPLYYDEYFGHDSAIFRIMGQWFLEGKTPYVDFFDHKGPLILFIEALGQSLIKGRFGLFVLEIINIFFSLILVFKIAKIFALSIKEYFILLFFFLLVLRFTIAEGNLTEEYSIVFIWLAIYMTLKFYFQDRLLSVWKVVVLGLSFSVPFWMRANNAGVIVGCAIFIFYILIKDKDWKQLRRFIIVLSITMLSFTILLLIYFSYLNALEEMLYTTFIFNVKYALNADVVIKDTKTIISFSVFVVLAVLILSTGTYLMYKNNNDRNLIVFSVFLFLFGIVPMCVGRLSGHYLMIVTPIISIGIVYILIFMREHSLYLRYQWGIVSLLVLVLGGSFQYKRSYFAHCDSDFVSICNEVMSNVSKEERNSVFGYGVSPRFYIISGVSPYIKYFILQDFHATVDKSIKTSINDSIMHKKPLWIVTEAKKINDLGNKELIALIETDYDIIAAKELGEESLRLYKLREEYIR